MLVNDEKMKISYLSTSIESISIFLNMNFNILSRSRTMSNKVNIYRLDSFTQITNPHVILTHCKCKFQFITIFTHL